MVNKKEIYYTLKAFSNMVKKNKESLSVTLISTKASSKTINMTVKEN